MNTSKLISLCVCLTFSSTLFASLSCYFDGKEFDMGDGGQRKGKTGEIICKNDDGKTIQKHQIQNGILMGKVMIIDSGIRKEYSTNKIGNIDGEMKVFNKDDILISQKKYENGSIIEERTYYPSNRRIKSITHGRMSIEYNDDSEITSLHCGDVAYLKEDKKLCGWDGESKVKAGQTQKTFLRGKLLKLEEFYANGKLEKVKTFDNKDSAEKTFFDTGAKKSEATYENNELVMKKTFYMNGNSESNISYEKAKGDWIETRKEYFDSGKPSLEGTYKDNDPIGVLKMYLSNGKLSQVEKYDDNSELDGEQIYYTTKGELSIQKYYSHGVLTREITYKEDGTKTDYDYYPDGSRKLKN